ncbi:hypothetical protein M0812_02998 [Anaeramoeba flamelloides]|uniref:DDE Tnp4 domain-containing protein n=1 Tax=Anaeramoeba flamelloides TaxID=1746091 RepID=A0AAV7YTT2_9EUKA|nr:hypothetical protein M0812_02998 [Anaeramoeba flamelloides]
MNIEIELENEEEIILPEHWGNRRNIENEEPVNENIIVVIPNIIWSKFKNNNNSDLLKIISGFDFDEFNDLFSKVKKKFRQKGRGGRRGGIRNYKQMPEVILEKLKIFFIKKNEESQIEEPLALMVDKGYKGVNQIKIFIPHFGKRENLTEEQNDFNRLIGKHRVIIEQFYGRLKNRNRVTTDRWRNEIGDFHNKVIGISIALTNYHIRCGHPIRRN